MGQGMLPFLFGPCQNIRFRLQLNGDYQGIISDNSLPDPALIYRERGDYQGIISDNSLPQKPFCGQPDRDCQGVISDNSLPKNENQALNSVDYQGVISDEDSIPPVQQCTGQGCFFVAQRKNSKRFAVRLLSHKNNSMLMMYLL